LAIGIFPNRTKASNEIQLKGDLIMYNANEILAKIEANMMKIKGFGVKKIGLFGSFARGEQTNTSDIDILVEFYQDQKTAFL
jgi:predicted nucleotidyltransferase